MALREIKLPETKPALEWILGRVVQKMTPQSPHALAQGVFFMALHSWALGHRGGRAGTEWDFALEPPGEVRRPLVPDVAYMSYARIPREEMNQTGIPRVAPDVVVEVISPGDRSRYIEEKIRVYLACGTTVIFLVDTDKKIVIARSLAAPVVFESDGVVVHPSLPGFAMPVSTLFESP